jgi:hypothetical protein
VCWTGTTACGAPAAPSSLLWLARHQGAEGGWSAASFDRCCVGPSCGGRGQPQHDVAVSGLAVVAFLRAGITPLARQRYEDPITHRLIGLGQVVAGGLSWLLARQDAGGRFDASPYDHAIATLAVTETFGLLGHGDEYLQAARRGLAVLASRHLERFSPEFGVDDLWAAMAIVEARRDRIELPSDVASTSVLAWLDRGPSAWSSTRGAGAWLVLEDLFATHPREEVARPARATTLRELPARHRSDVASWYFGSSPSPVIRAPGDRGRGR